MIGIHMMKREGSEQASGNLSLHRKKAGKLVIPEEVEEQIMTEQQKAAVEAMQEWLAHPAELGKAPLKIEIAREFDWYEMHYYILKYKKSFLSP